MPSPLKQLTPGTRAASEIQRRAGFPGFPYLNKELPLTLSGKLSFRAHFTLCSSKFQSLHTWAVGPPDPEGNWFVTQDQNRGRLRHAHGHVQDPAGGGGSQGNDLITSNCKYKNTTTCEQTRSTQQAGPRAPQRGCEGSGRGTYPQAAWTYPRLFGGHVQVLPNLTALPKQGTPDLGAGLQLLGGRCVVWGPRGLAAPTPSPCGRVLGGSPRVGGRPREQAGRGPRPSPFGCGQGAHTPARTLHPRPRSF